MNEKDIRRTKLIVAREWHNRGGTIEPSLHVGRPGGGGWQRVEVDLDLTPRDVFYQLRDLCREHSQPGARAMAKYMGTYGHTAEPAPVVHIETAGDEPISLFGVVRDGEIVDWVQAVDPPRWFDAPAVN